MGRCPRCGGYNGMEGNGLCETCAAVMGSDATQERNREIRNEQNLKQREREARAAETSRRAAMTQQQQQAEDRQIRHNFFRPVRTVLIVLLVAAVIAGVLFGINFVKNRVLGSSSVYEKVYSALLEKYENHPEILTDVQTKSEPGMFVINEMKDDLKDSDYYLNLYTEGRVEIQKYTLGENTRYYFSFSSEYGDLADKKYAITDGLIYEIGEEKKVYYESSVEYAALLEKLYAYLPENCLGKGPFTSESWLTSAEDDISADIAYGDNITALYDSWNGFYFEKTATLFARLQYNEGGVDSMMNLPQIEECTEIK